MLWYIYSGDCTICILIEPFAEDLPINWGFLLQKIWQCQKFQSPPFMMIHQKSLTCHISPLQGVVIVDCPEFSLTSPPFTHFWARRGSEGFISCQGGARFPRGIGSSPVALHGSLMRLGSHFGRPYVGF